MATAFIGLGSNIGDRLGNLRRAVRLLEENGVTVVKKSSVYETKPVGYVDQPDFTNAVVQIWTEISPKELIGLTKKIEALMGRERSIHWGPRKIDLDILLYDQLSVSADDLELPHPQVANRAFVLVPLAEIAADFRHPSGKTMGELRKALGKVAGVSRYCRDKDW